MDNQYADRLVSAIRQLNSTLELINRNLVAMSQKSSNENSIIEHNLSNINQTLESIDRNLNKK